VFATASLLASEDGVFGHSGATAPVSHRLPRTIALIAGNLSNGSARSGAPIRESPQIATSTTRLTLVRHAPSDATRRSAFPLDEPLDARGLDEARALAPRLGRFDGAWTSPAARARDTAQALGLDAATAAELDECDFGAWRGRTLAELDDDDPVAVAAWIEDPAAAPHGGESLLALLARVRGWLDARAHDGGRLVAVTHAGPIRAALVCALEAPPHAFWRLDVAPLSRTVLHAHDGRWTVRGVNLPPS
jgi:broad specificity phosphatase PhoE